MQRKLLALSVLAALAPMAHAVDVTAFPGLLATQPQAGAVTINFSGLSLDGFEFSQITGLTTGNLISVSVNATLDASVGYTYADDLTLYVDVLPLSTGGVLQIGGYSDLSAAQRYTWANGGSSSPGTTLIDTVILATPISFSGGASDPAVWLGNGYGADGANGTWSGSITLNFAAGVVPEPSSWALGLFGGMGLLAWGARRRRAGGSAA